MAVLAVRDLFVSYGPVQALRGVSFEAASGAVGLLGPNGAGKSTLIKALLGLVPPSSGSVSLLGQDSRHLGPALRDKVGYVPEREGVRSGMSGVAWVSLLGELSGLPRRSAVERAHEVIQYAGLGEARYRAASEYSTGMQQRLKLAAALVHDPTVVLLDEPTAGMDPQGREDMLELCRDLVREGKTILFSTHILKDVEAVCSQVVILHKGRVAAGAGIETWTRGEAQHFLVQWQGDPRPLPGGVQGLRVQGRGGPGRAVQGGPSRGQDAPDPLPTGGPPGGDHPPVRAGGHLPGGGFPRSPGARTTTSRREGKGLTTKTPRHEG